MSPCKGQETRIIGEGVKGKRMRILLRNGKERSMSIGGGDREEVSSKKKEGGGQTGGIFASITRKEAIVFLL
jgi:hypothetical protein